MIEPITSAAIVGLAASKFTESAVGEAAKKLIAELWDVIATHFNGRSKAEAAMAQIEVSKGKSPEAKATLVQMLNGVLSEDNAFTADVQQLAKQIINMPQSQTRKTTMMTQTNLNQSKGYQVQADSIRHVGDHT